MNPKWKTIQDITDFVKNNPKNNMNQISMSVGMTYSHTINVIKFLADKKIIVMKRKGKSYEVSIR